MAFPRNCGKVSFTAFYDNFYRIISMNWLLYRTFRSINWFYRRFAVGKFDLHGDGHLVGIVGSVMVGWV